MGGRALVSEALTARPPVVVIHGALRSQAGLWPIVWYLRRLGFDARAFGYPTRAQTLEQHGERLEGFVGDWLGEPAPLLGILTHSMGGLVARAYLARAGAAAQSQRQRVVMLAPPATDPQRDHQRQAGQQRLVALDRVHGRRAGRADPGQALQ